MRELKEEKDRKEDMDLEDKKTENRPPERTEEKEEKREQHAEKKTHESKMVISTLKWKKLEKGT
jgi:hypothetical protein